jgi:CheY-like chemotaxis protein
MGGASGDHPKKDPYRVPTCESRSVSEVAALIRKNLLAKHETRGLPLSAEELARPILVVENYQGDMRSMKQAFHEKGMQCHSGAATNDSELALICQVAGEVQPDALLLDLRRFKSAGHDVLEEIGGEPQLRRIPLVILVDSAAAQICGDLGNYWRLRKPVDSGGCVAALQSLLDLQIAVLKLSPEKKREKRSVFTRDSGSKASNGPGKSIDTKTDWEALRKEIE